ncbi:low-specificity L-threonine aldolase [Jannaschia sp. Os4]|uniref:low-specificity L-threonine aldolase n=1 Tax=Jannaschia sp. Os4 TaxID=2807617 RepID=UPI00193A15AF|nr:low-specificity L-threonine aldolase [Jannaschia sp. Os4]MBM2575886.1 low-specificity L-threonine aldolase [Jannaschia sp. Os4]
MTYPIRQTARTNGTIADLRSDTVTRPDAAMRAAMAAAEVGDDVYGEDPTIAALEERVAGTLGKAAAVMFPTATQSNLAALLSHCARGEEVLTGHDYHVRKYEAGGGSVLGGLVFHDLSVRPDGGLSATDVAAAVKEDDSHFAVTRLLVLENTHNGRAVPLDTQGAALAAARDAGLSTHLDGSRLFNAAEALGVPPARVAEGFDTVTICLSKGLGGPAGAVLSGPADLVSKARRWRKMLGGGMRQAGVIAAAGLHALDHNLAGLASDRARAERLRAALRALPWAEVEDGESNMVWLALRDPSHADALAAHLADAGITVSPGAKMRLVLHRDVDDAALDAVVAAFEGFAP